MLMQGLTSTFRTLRLLPLMAGMCNHTGQSYKVQLFSLQSNLVNNIIKAYC